MNYHDEIDPQRITRAMRDRVEALASTADMIDVLAEIAAESARTMQQAAASGHKTSDLGEWRTIETMLRLASAQADIIKEVSEQFAEHRVAA